MTDKHESNSITPLTILIEVPDSNYLCKSCKDVNTKPYQLHCGCRLCFKCLQIIQNEEKCVLCDEKVDLKSVIKDVAFMKEVNNLFVKCKSCTWNGKLIEFNKHYEENHQITKLDNFSAIEKEHLNTGIAYQLKLLYENLSSKLTALENKFSNLAIENGKSLEIQKQTELDEFNSKIRSLRIKSESMKEEIKKRKGNCEDYLDEIEKYEKILNSFEEDYLDKIKKQLVSLQSTNIMLDKALLAKENDLFQNGKCLWKISNFNEKLNEAKTSKQSFIYSPVFHTSKYGYKLCVKAYLNGDATTRNTYLSLYLVIMRSDFDALLKWPFSQDITFILIDQQQNDKCENIIQSFKPDSKSSSFSRPTSEMNNGSGIPLFCTLNKLYSKDNEYIKDDCLFIKIVVDTRNIENI